MPDSNAAAISGKPQIELDHVSIAPRPDGGVCIIATLSIALDDAHVVDLALRAIGALARARGMGDAS